MADKKLKVEFKEGKKVVTYPDGTVSQYPRSVITAHKERLLKMKEDLDNQIAVVDKDLADADASEIK
jgi:hypothetical protein